MKKFTLFLSAILLACATSLQAADTYVQLTSIASIDESAKYVLGEENTGFHYSGISSWGLTALPSVQTPIYYTLKKAADGNSFTATATISEKEYYLTVVPNDNKWELKATTTQNPNNINLIIGTTAVEETNYAVANATTKDRHLRINSTKGLRSYAGTTGTMAYFYKVTFSTATLTSLDISGTPTQLNYNAGEAFNPAGLTVTAYYSDGTNEDVSKNVDLVFTTTPEVLVAGMTSVLVKATLNGVSSKDFVVNNIEVTALHPGEEVTVTFEAGVDNAPSANKTTIAKQGITLTATTFDNTSYYQTFANSTFKAISTQGKIKSIVFTCKEKGTTKYGPGNYSVPADGVGTYTYDSIFGTWTGSAAEVVLSADVQVRMTKVEVTYVVADPNAPDAPTISGETTFHGTTDVTITAGEGLVIYYTTNGDEPTIASTLYNAPFTIAATTMVKAIAVNQITNAVSDVAVKTFTHQNAVNLAAIDYSTDGTKVFLNPVTVVYSNEPYNYLKDETGVGLLYGGSLNLNAGSVVEGLAVTTKLYTNLPELEQANTLEDLTITAGVAPAPAEALAVPTAEEVNTYLVLKGITLAQDAATTSGKSLQNVKVAFKDGTVELRDQFGVVADGTIKAGSYDVEGFVSVYNTTVQFFITKITSTATALSNTMVNTQTLKTIENGQLIILRDGKKFNAVGAQLQ